MSDIVKDVVQDIDDVVDIEDNKVSFNISNILKCFGLCVKAKDKNDEPDNKN